MCAGGGSKSVKVCIGCGLQCDTICIHPSIAVASPPLLANDNMQIIFGIQCINFECRQLILKPKFCLHKISQINELVEQSTQTHTHTTIRNGVVRSVYTACCTSVQYLCLFSCVERLMYRSRPKHLISNRKEIDCDQNTIERKVWKRRCGEAGPMGAAHFITKLKIVRQFKSDCMDWHSQSCVVLVISHISNLGKIDM